MGGRVRSCRSASYRTALPFVIAPLIDALVERGELEEAGSWPALTGLEAGWPEEFGFTFLLDSLARLRLAQGRAQDALHLARECARRQRAWGIRNPGFVAYGSTLAAALARHRPHVGGARRVRRADRPRARASASRVRRGWRSRVLGTITGDAERLHAAVTVLEAAPLERAHALFALGGREPLREALDLAERCGATALATRARDALVATGARPRRAQLTGAAALTAAQLRVAQLAAQGLGNRAIAERLFLTEKTVEGHLGAAYRKLGITSRSQLRTDQPSRRVSARWRARGVSAREPGQAGSGAAASPRGRCFGSSTRGRVRRVAGELPRATSASRGTTTTGTGETRTIFDAREPRNTRATGPIELEPTTSTSPSAHSTSSIASAQVSPWPTTVSTPSRDRGAHLLRPLRDDRVVGLLTHAGHDRRPRPDRERRHPQRRADPLRLARGDLHQLLARAAERRRHAPHRARRRGSGTRAARARSG